MSRIHTRLLRSINVDHESDRRCFIWKHYSHHAFAISEDVPKLQGGVFIMNRTTRRMLQRMMVHARVAMSWMVAPDNSDTHTPWDMWMRYKTVKAEEIRV